MTEMRSKQDLQVWMLSAIIALSVVVVILASDRTYPLLPFKPTPSSFEGSQSLKPSQSTASKSAPSLSPNQAPPDPAEGSVPPPEQTSAGSRTVSEDELEWQLLPDEAMIPFTKVDGSQVQFDVTYDGKPMKAWLDTGVYANFGFNHLRDASLPLPQEPADSTTSGWNLKEIPVWHTKADIAAGSLRRKIQIELEEDMKTPPFVGMALLKDLSFEIDNQRQLIVVRKECPVDLPIDSQYDIALEKEGGIPLVWAQINGYKRLCRFSTAVPTSIFSWDTLKECGAKGLLADQVRSTGIGGPSTQYAAIVDIDFGPVKAHRWGVHVSTGHGYDTIGQDILLQCHYVIDSKRNLFRFFK